MKRNKKYTEQEVNRIYKQIFDLFTARKDAYAEARYDKKTKRWAYTSIKRQYTLSIMKRHISDPKFPGIGVYPLLDGNVCKWVAADFDLHNKRESDEIFTALKYMYKVAEHESFNIYPEISKSGNGLHIWIFFQDAVNAWTARQFMMGLLTRAKANHLSSYDRLFPSQDRLNPNSKGLGNLIHLPFSAHFISEGTHFTDKNELRYTNAPEDMENFIACVQPVTLEDVDKILDGWGIAADKNATNKYEMDNNQFEHDEDGLEKVLADPFIVWCKNNPSEVDYQAWIGMMTNLLPYGSNGVEIIHQLSAIDRIRYDQDNTDKVILGCRSLNPITHRWLESNTNYPGSDIVLSYRSPAAAGIKATSQSQYNPVFETNGCYWKLRKNQVPFQLSNFVLVPTAIITIDNKNHYSYDLHINGDVVKNITLNAEQIVDPRKLKTAFLESHRNATYYGRVDDTLRIVNYISDRYQDTKTIVGKSQVGIYPSGTEDEWMVLTEKGGWTSANKIEDYSYSNPAQKKEISHKFEASIEKQSLQDISELMFEFNTPAVCGTIWGWMSALYVRERLESSKGVYYPSLVLHGEAGAGKSETRANLLQPFFGDLQPPYMCPEATRFTLMTLLASSNTFPIFLEEYKPYKLSPVQKNLISQAIRTVYNKGRSLRGRQDLTTIEYQLSAPICIIGEMGLTEPAIIERSLDVFLSKSESRRKIPGNSPDRTKAFFELAKLPIDKFGNFFLNWTLGLKGGVITGLFEEVRIYDHDRTSDNISVAFLGLELLAKFFSEYDIRLDISDLKREVQSSQEKYARQHGDTISVVDLTIKAFITMQLSHELNQEELAFGKNKSELWIYTRLTYPKFRKWAREHQFEHEILDEHEFIQQLRKSPYYIGYKTALMDGGPTSNGKRAKIHALKVDGLVKRGILINEEIPE
jgi:hypothetical protein